MHYTLKLHIVRLCDLFFLLLFTFWEKNLCPPPPHFSSLSYAVVYKIVFLFGFST